MELIWIKINNVFVILVGVGKPKQFDFDNYFINALILVDVFFLKLYAFWIVSPTLLLEEFIIMYKPGEKTATASQNASLVEF